MQVNRKKKASAEQRKKRVQKKTHACAKHTAHQNTYH